MMKRYFNRNTITINQVIIHTAVKIELTNINILCRAIVVFLFCKDFMKYASVEFVIM